MWSNMLQKKNPQPVKKVQPQKLAEPEQTGEYEPPKLELVSEIKQTVTIEESKVTEEGEIVDLKLQQMLVMGTGGTSLTEDNQL